MLSELTGPERAALTPSAVVGALLMPRAVNDVQLSPGLLSTVAEGLAAH